MPRGRPVRHEEPTPLERLRGKLVAAWVRSGMAPPHVPIELSNADVARMTGLSPSAIGYILNDCFDRSENRMKLPQEETILLIADKLRLDPKKGLEARFAREQGSLSNPEVAKEMDDYYREVLRHLDSSMSPPDILRAVAAGLEERGSYSSATPIRASADPLASYGDEVDARPYLYALSSVTNASGGLGIERIVDGDAPGEDYTRGKFRVRAIRVRGNSMEPVLHDGEVALVLPPEAVYDQCFVTATVDYQNAVCKRIRIPEEGGSYLEGINEEGIITEDRFVVTGVVADKVSPLLPPKNGRPF